MHTQGVAELVTTRDAAAGPDDETVDFAMSAWSG